MNSWQHRLSSWLVQLLCFASLSAGGLTAEVYAAEDTALLAFPGAVGFGRHAKGGRGGEVVAVSNLHDAGPGSLRAALSQRHRRQGQIIPRTVVFRTAGTITLESPLWIREPYLSIAAQTAPGGGIALRTSGSFDGAALTVKSHDIVIQYLRIRPARAPGDSCCGDALTVLDGEDVIIDHCSLSWASDEVLDIWGQSRRITVQHSIIAQARRDHPGKVSGKGLLIGDSSDQVTLYGNLLAHHLQRSPLIFNNTDGTFQVVNNLVYNWRHFASEFLGRPGQTRVNLIGNIYRPGPETRPERYEILAGNGASVYLEDNQGPRKPIPSLPDWDMVGHHRPQYNRPAPAELRAHNAFPGPQLPMLGTQLAYSQILQSAGARQPQIDSFDQRLIEEVRDKRSSLHAPPLEASDWPVLRDGNAYPDGDGDGMDDRWERQQHLDPDDPNDRNDDPDSNGYTHLEEFLHHQAGI